MNWKVEERRILLSVAGLGEGVVERLSEVGIASFEDLNRVGVDAVIERICCRVGGPSWKNRRRALQKALDLRFALHA